MSTTISFECQACGADTELEMSALIESSKTLKCSNCAAKPPAHRAHVFSTALEDLVAATADLRAKFKFEIELDSHELPEPFGRFDQEGGIDFEDATLDEEATKEEEDEEEEDEDGIPAGFQEEEDEDEDDDVDSLVDDLDDDDDDFDDLDEDEEDDFDDFDEDEEDDEDFDDFEEEDAEDRP